MRHASKSLISYTMGRSRPVQALAVPRHWKVSPGRPAPRQVVRRQREAAAELGLLMRLAGLLVHPAACTPRQAAVVRRSSQSMHQGAGMLGRGASSANWVVCMGKARASEGARWWSTSQTRHGGRACSACLPSICRTRLWRAALGHQPGQASAAALGPCASWATRPKRCVSARV